MCETWHGRESIGGDTRKLSGRRNAVIDGPPEIRQYFVLTVRTVKEVAMWRAVGVFLLCILLGSVGCAATQEAKSVQKSGFLGDYSILREGKRSMVSVTRRIPMIRTDSINRRS